MKQMTRLTFLGTGTSQGIPIIACTCPVCSSSHPKDKRLRSAAYVEHGGRKILIDVGPDFRGQMLSSGIRDLDGILITHAHKDHIGGLDDVRALNYINHTAVDIYCEERVLHAIQSDFPYAFADQKYPGVPEWRIHLIDTEPFRLDAPEARAQLEWVHDEGYYYKQPDGSLSRADNRILCAAHDGADIIPIRGFHGDIPVLGFRFGRIAYITDMNRIPEEELAKLHGLEHVTLNTVGYKPHHSHFSLDEALEMAGRIGAEHTWLTHLSHTFPSHPDFCAQLAQRCANLGIHSHVAPAYDGLTLCADA